MTSSIRIAPALGTGARAGVGLALGLFVTALLPLAAGAELAKWDQERVTKYATELSVGCDELNNAVRAEGREVNPAQQQAMHQVKEAVKSLCTSARQLQAHLESGDGREDTKTIYRNLQILRRDAEEAARRALITESTMDKVFAVGGPLMRLRPYYEEEPAREG